MTRKQYTRFMTTLFDMVDARIRRLDDDEARDKAKEFAQIVFIPLQSDQAANLMGITADQQPPVITSSPRRRTWLLPRPVRKPQSECTRPRYLPSCGHRQDIPPQCTRQQVARLDQETPNQTQRTIVSGEALMQIEELSRLLVTHCDDHHSLPARAVAEGFGANHSSDIAEFVLKGHTIEELVSQAKTDPEWASHIERAMETHDRLNILRCQIVALEKRMDKLEPLIANLPTKNDMNGFEQRLTKEI